MLKKSNKTWIALMLSGIISSSFLLSACGKKETSGEANGKKDVSTEYSLPFVKDGSVTLSYAGVDNWYPPASYTQNLPVWQEVEKRTGIKIKWEVMAPNQYDTSMQTRIAAGEDLPDIIALPPLWGGDVVKYGNEGVIIPLEDLIDKYAPNIKAIFEKYPEIEKQLTAPNGHIYNVSELFIEGNEVNPKSLILRKDWLDKLGLKEPETLDEWYTVLKAFKEKDPNGNGKQDEIPLVCSSGLNIYGYFAGAFGLPTDAIVPQMWVEDGKVKFILRDDRYKELITFANKLFKEGLLVQGPKSDEAAVDSLISQNVVGVSAHFVDVVDRWNNLLKKSGVQNGEYKMVVPARGSDGKLGMVKRASLGMQYAISKSCKTPELAIKWIDYIWANPEGVDLTHFGIEGKTCTKGEDGKLHFTDFVTKNPDGLDPASALRSTGAFPALFDHQTKDFMLELASPKTREAIKQFEPYMVEPFPDIIGTDEETEKITTLMADINTYINEMMIKFVMGKEPISNYDKFLEQLNKMGIDEVIKIKQQQYDRYSKAK